MSQPIEPIRDKSRVHAISIVRQMIENRKHPLDMVRERARALHKRTTKISSIRIKYGPFLISAYSLVSMMTIFVFHEIARDCSEKLYALFKDEYPDISKAWEWVDGCKMNQLMAWITGIITGIMVFVAVYSLAAYGTTATQVRKYNEVEYAMKRRMNMVIAVATIGVFFAVFVLASLLFDPHLFYRPIDMLYGLVLSGIVGFSVVLYNGNKMRNVRRRDFYEDKDLQLEEFRFDHDTSKETFHLSLIVFVTILVSIPIALVFQMFQQLQPEIFNSDPYIINTAKNVAYVLIIVIGFFVGVLLQELQNLVDVRHVIRRYHRYYSRRSRPSK